MDRKYRERRGIVLEDNSGEWARAALTAFFIVDASDGELFD